MVTIPRKRGRPSKAEIAAREAAKNIPPRSSAEILSDLQERFKILEILTKGLVAQNVRAVTVTGAPGVGKTYTVERILQAAKDQIGTKFEIVRGAISAVNLYKLAYRMKDPGSVLVLDDADTIFGDEDALNILKVICDSSDNREVSWLKESWVLANEEIPNQFSYNGGAIFISNLDWQSFVDNGKNKYAQHFEALISRSLYLDLRLHTREELGIWVNHIATEGNIFHREGLTKNQTQQVISFITEYRDQLRELSIRTVIKAAQLIKTHNNGLKLAKVLLLKRR